MRFRSCCWTNEEQVKRRRRTKNTDSWCATASGKRLCFVRRLKTDWKSLARLLFLSCRWVDSPCPHHVALSSSRRTAWPTVFYNHFAWKQNNILCLISIYASCRFVSLFTLFFKSFSFPLSFALLSVSRHSALRTCCYANLLHDATFLCTLIDVINFIHTRDASYTWMPITWLSREFFSVLVWMKHNLCWHIEQLLERTCVQHCCSQYRILLTPAGWFVLWREVNEMVHVSHRVCSCTFVLLFSKWARRDTGKRNKCRVCDIYRRQFTWMLDHHSKSESDASK